MPNMCRPKRSTMLAAVLLGGLPFGLCAASLLVASAVLTAQPSTDEPPPTVTASKVLTAAQLKGAHHQVAEAVTTPGFFHEFTVTSEYGTFKAVGRRELDRVIREINAIHELSQVSKSDIFVEAAGQSLVNVGKGAANAVVNPVDTAKGVGGGLKRMGTNIGRRSKRAADEALDEDPELSEEEKAAQGSGTTNAAYGVLGVNSAVRRWAAKVGVDPYTTNSTLKTALEGIAKVDAAGSLTTKFVVPIPPLVGSAATVGNLVWTTDPESLRKMNEERAKALGVHGRRRQGVLPEQSPDPHDADAGAGGAGRGEARECGRLHHDDHRRHQCARGAVLRAQRRDAAGSCTRRRRSSRSSPTRRR